MDLSSGLTLTVLALVVLALVLLIVLAMFARRHGVELERMQTRLASMSKALAAMSDDGIPVEEEKLPSHIAVVLNPSKFDDADDIRARISQVAESFDGMALSIYETTPEDPGEGQAKQAVRDGAELVIAAGGDGTVRNVAKGLAHSGVAMGIAPAGTGNLLARNLGLPLNAVEEAMIAAINGTPTKSDVGWLRWGMSPEEAKNAEPQIFLVMAGFGADAEIMGSTDSVLKARIGWLAYVVAGAKKLAGKSHRIIATFPDGRRLAMRARTVILGNVGELPGGIVLMPEASMSNGKLEVMFADWRGAAGFTQLFTHVLNQTKASKTFLSAIQRHLTASLMVSASSPWPVQLDGDTEGEGTHLFGEVDKSALIMRIPAQDQGA